MKTLRYLFLFPGLLLAPCVFPQRTEEWTSAEVEFALPKKFSLETKLESRALCSAGIWVHTPLVQFGLNYKISKRFDVGYTYRFEWQLEEDLHYYYRNKMMFDFRFDYPLGRFKFYYRARLLRLARTYIENENDLLPELHWQNRFIFSFDIPGSPLEPRVFSESFTPLSGSRLRNIDQQRFGAELMVPVTGHQTLTGGGFYMSKPLEEWRRGVVFQLSWKLTVG